MAKRSARGQGHWYVACFRYFPTPYVVLLPPLNSTPSYLDMFVQNTMVTFTVFTQFVDNQGLMGRILQDRGINFLYYIGKMTDEEREDAKEEFASSSEVKVMVSRPWMKPPKSHPTPHLLRPSLSPCDAAARL